MDPTGTLVIIFIFVFSIVFVSKSAKLLRAWINRKKPTYDQEKFDRLAKAFIQYKKQSERQIKRLETEIKKIGSHPSSAAEESTEEQPTNKSIEIEPRQAQEHNTTNSGKMENMLRKKG